MNSEVSFFQVDHEVVTDTDRNVIISFTQGGLSPDLLGPPTTPNRLSVLDADIQFKFLKFEIEIS